LPAAPAATGVQGLPERFAGSGLAGCGLRPSTLPPTGLPPTGLPPTGLPPGAKPSVRAGPRGRWTEPWSSEPSRSEPNPNPQTLTP
jgi:hypothetical protein